MRRGEGGGKGVEARGRGGRGKGGGGKEKGRAREGEEGEKGRGKGEKQGKIEANNYDGAVQCQWNLFIYLSFMQCPNGTFCAVMHSLLSECKLREVHKNR